MTRLVFCLSVVMLLGCGQSSQRPFTDHSRDPEAFALDVKQVVVDSVADARTSREPEDQVSNIVNMLDDLSGRPTGQYRDTYDQLLSLAREIRAACEAANGRPSDLETRLQELLALADQLPGHVTPAERPRD
jgi:hypothetical protein